MAASDNPFSDIEAPGFRQSLGFAGRTLALVWQTAPRLTLAIAATTVLVALVPALAAYVAKLIVDTVLLAIDTGTEADRQQALIWVAAEAGILGVGMALRRILVHLKRLLHAELGFAVSTKIFDKTSRFDLETIERPDVQQQILLARQHASARPYNLANRVIESGQHTLTLVSLAVVLWTFSPWAVAIILAGGVPLFLAELRFSGTAFRFYTGRTPEIRQRNYLEGLMTSDSAAVERLHADSSPAIRDRYAGLFRWLFGEDMRLQTGRTIFGVILLLVSSAFFLGGKAWVVWATVLGAISLGQMTMYAAVLKQGQNSVTTLLATLSGGYEDLLYVSNLYALLGRDSGVARGRNAGGPEAGKGYELTDVSFHYPNGNRPALRDISLTIPSGQKLGIVGANGSGKSTLVKLLTGLYLPQSGQATLDGLDIREWDKSALFARTAAVFQPSQRYSLTAGENIAMGEGLRVTDRDRWAAAAEAGLAGAVLDDLPEGLDTKLSKQFLDGRELSGGQWQRLALARAMLREGADILILDEPTAALDPATEADFVRALKEKDGTLIVISHRLSTLRWCDRIVVLEKGRIVQSGTPEHLASAPGAYRDLFREQAEFYGGKDVSADPEKDG
ncbi:ABC transporter ATP-binding protein [Hyphobacterium sp. CCMP332]|uniref:ABC transporter ATP-binding protein n=1 Tax=Hyphobacterium sp. CCMP332 TaxID=2749086 RepID=UPI00164F7393|nr:ABC transporter ATP-binding protein [Hyphobacterium sp. CCMP332]QNL19414.1 ABC transporter ATP-binding protein [Hyphobacterium sp. CCMP332]